MEEQSLLEITAFSTYIKMKKGGGGGRDKEHALKMNFQKTFSRKHTIRLLFLTLGRMLNISAFMGEHLKIVSFD